jgi:hypothetical protein
MDNIGKAHTFWNKEVRDSEQDKDRQPQEKHTRPRDEKVRKSEQDKDANRRKAHTN